eukprot:s281_g22.t1
MALPPMAITEQTIEALCDALLRRLLPVLQPLVEEAAQKAAALAVRGVQGEPQFGATLLGSLPSEETVTVDWTFTNTSLQPWPPGCRLRFLGGSLRPRSNGQGHVEAVPPRGTVTLQCEMVTPAEPGACDAQWQRLGAMERLETPDGHALSPPMPVHGYVAAGRDAGAAAVPVAAIAAPAAAAVPVMQAGPSLHATASPCNPNSPAVTVCGRPAVQSGSQVAWQHVFEQFFGAEVSRAHLSAQSSGGAMAPALRRPVLALLPLLARAAVTKPDGCPDERWTGNCAGTATCESLAIAGLICGDQDGGVGIIPGCNTACAEPCCITTTTTTQTTTSQTATTYTATFTSTATTATATLTATLTRTSQTATVTGSTTHTATVTATTTVTGTTTVTVTTVTMTTVAETTAGTTAAVETTAASSEGPFRRLVVRIKVTGVKDETRYVTDSRVSTAYREAMEEVTGLGKEKVDLQMVVTAPGNLTVSYILNVPEADAASSMEKVTQSLMKETASSFNVLLQEHIDALVGHGHYTQQVVSMESEEDGATGVSATDLPRASIWIAAFTAVAAWLGGETF